MDVDITMMMQLNRLPELSSHYELPEFEYSGGSVASNEATAPPFSQTLVQEPFTLAPSINFSPNFDTNNLIDLAGAKVLQKRNSMEAMREMIFRIAVMQPIHIDPESVKPPKRRNVKISKDPQSVAARQRRERISERIRILQRLVPGGTKMDTASMLDEAIHYVKFLKKQVQSLEKAGVSRPIGAVGFPTATMMGNLSYSSVAKACQPFYQTDGGLYMNA